MHVECDSDAAGRRVAVVRRNLYHPALESFSALLEPFYLRAGSG